MVNIRFDWQAFCAQHNIAFVTTGPNTSRGHISIHCPWCGESDRSGHLGLKLDRADPAWGCFRNAKHRGRSPRRLVQRLLGVSFDEAWRIVGAQAGAADEGDLSASIKRLQAGPQGGATRSTAPELPFPQGFKPVRPGGYGGRFLAYLERERGFPAADLAAVCLRYGMHYALSGDFAWRLIFPIHGPDGRRVGWTGRDIRPGAKLRYRTTEALPARSLYNAHLAVRSSAETLVIVEGPVDAIKVDYFGSPLGVCAVGTLGTALPRERRAALAALARRFKRVALLFDEGTLPEVTSLAPELSEAAGVPVSLWRPGIKDPGAMSAPQIVKFLYDHLQPKGEAV